MLRQFVAGLRLHKQMLQNVLGKKPPGARHSYGSGEGYGHIA